MLKSMCVLKATLTFKEGITSRWHLVHFLLGTRLTQKFITMIPFLAYIFDIKKTPSKFLSTISETIMLEYSSFRPTIKYVMIPQASKLLKKH